MPAASALRGEARLGAPTRAAQSKGRVRALSRSDMPELVSLYLRVFGEPPGGAETATAYLGRLLFEHPWQHDDLPSLVFEGPDGMPSGLLGVVPRPVERGAERLRLAIGHHFMVAPDARGTLASVQLMRAFLNGPQDVALLEACTPWRRLWESLGGATAFLTGLRWLHVFAPCRAAVGLAASRWRPAMRLTAAAGLADRALARVAPRFAPDVADDALDPSPLDAAALAGAVAALPARAARPIVDADAARWLLDHLAQKTHRGQLHGAVLRQRDGAVAGWYLYFAKPFGMSHVVAIHALPGRLETVFAHLVADARRQGVGVIAGQVDRNLLGVRAVASSLIQQPVDSWQLVHARRPELVHDVHSGQFLLSRLESDWWMTY